MRAYSDEIDVQTLVPATIRAKAIASEIFKIYPPAFFVGRVGRKIVLGVGRPFADSRNVTLNLSR